MRQPIAIVLLLLGGTDLARAARPRDPPPQLPARKTTDKVVKADKAPRPSPPSLPPSEEEFTDCHRYPKDKRFRFTLRGEVTVADLVAVVGDISCRTIVMGPQVATHAGKVTLQVPDLVSAPEVYRMFHSSLEVLGLTIERSGTLWKVVEAARGARESAALVVGAEETPPGEQFVTRLVRLRHAAAPEVAELLNRMKGHEGEVSVYAPGQSLVVTDRGDNVRRMEDLVRALDVAQPGQRIFTIAVHAGRASELAAAIDKVLQASRGSAIAPAVASAAASSSASAAAGDRAARTPGAPTLVPVDPARLLIVVGDEPTYERVARLAERIDPAPADGGTSQVHVIYLAHTNAEDMAATLQALGLSARAPSAPGATARTGTSGAPTASPSGGGGGASPLQGDVRIGADKVSNAIVVFAGAQDFLMVRDLVTKLDLPRRQVYVEAAVLDLSVDRARALGVALHGGQDVGGGTTVFGASGGNGTSSLVTDAASLAALFASGGLSAGVFGKAFQIGGVNVPSFGVVLKALESSKDVNVISQPNLLTMDNEKASISVGQSIPFQTQALGAATASTTAAVPTVLSTYQRQDVALKLELTPHLNDSESIRLELDGEISDVPDGQSTATPGGPTTNKRTIKTAVVVGDGETVVLGGLQKQSESETLEKVPVLGDVPILGRLFQSKSRQRMKQDLVIAITPWVIRGPEDLRRIFERKQKEQREFMEMFEAQRPDFAAPVDYGRKRGLLAEIELTARKADAEARMMREAEEARRPPVAEGEVE
jgi:general secretion pathway protein D